MDIVKWIPCEWMFSCPKCEKYTSWDDNCYDIEKIRCPECGHEFGVVCAKKETKQ